ncbi:MAG: DUF1566 domain-containing protein, partial [Proteobacteria bacterium]|nr:DUF1566 domain-containing protein [Pseudomonadota bacterium]
AYTDTQGNFVFADVPVGDYEIKYSYTGYASTTPTAIQVAKGLETSTDPVALSFISSVGGDPMAGGILKGVALVEESVASNGSGPFRTIVFKRLIQKNVLIPDLYAAQTVSSACKGCAVKVWPKNGESEDSGISGQTDDNGEFTVSNLEPNVYQVEITSDGEEEGIQKDDIVVQGGKTTNAGDLLLEQMGLVQGTVLLEGETDHSAVSVTIPGTSHMATTAADGSFTISLIPAGSYTLSYSKDAFARQSLEIEVKSGETAAVEQATLTTAFGDIGGSVTLNGETDHSSTLVSLGNTGDVVLADSSGYYAFSNVPPGSYTIFLYSAGFTAAKIENVEVTAGNQAVPGAVALSKNISTGNIYGTVELENASDPIGASVLVLETGQSTVVNSQGGFLLSELEPGFYNLEIHKQGFSTFKLENHVVLVGVTTTSGNTLLAQNRGNVRGIVLLDGESNHAGIAVGLEGTAFATTTDAAGNYSLSDVPIGSYNLVFSKTNYNSATQSNVAISVNTVLNAPSETLSPLPGSFAGIFLKEGFASHDGIVVSVGGQSAITGAEGTVDIGSVPVGLQTLTAVGVGFKTYEIQIVIAANGSYSLPTVSLVPIRGIVAGIVSLDGSGDLAGVEVTLLGTSISTTTAFDGTFRIQAPVGNYSGLTFQKTNFSDLTYTETVTVTEAGEANIPTQTLVQNANGLSSTATLLGQSDHSLIQVLIEGKAGTATNGYSRIVSVGTDGTWSVDDLPIGEYIMTITYPDGTWETVVYEISIVKGDPQTELPVDLKQVYVQINGGAAATVSSLATLTLGASEAVEMRIGNSMGAGTWESFAATKSWTLPVQGSNTVYVTYRDGSSQEIGTVSAAIHLDSIAAITAVTEDSGGASLIRGNSIRFTLNADGETGGTATIDFVGYQSGIRLYDHGLQGDDVAGDGIYTAAFPITSGTDIDNATITGNFTDPYGNTAAPVNATGTVTIGTPPYIGAVQVLPSTDAQSAIVQWLTDEAADSLVEYGTTSSYDASLDSAEAVLNHQLTLTGLTRGTIYHYRVLSTDAAGHQSFTQDKTFMVAPAITVGVSAYPGDGEAVLVWSSNTEQNLTGYNVYRSTTSGSGFVKRNATPVTDSIYADQGLSNGTTYYYKVSALDSFAIEGALSSEASATPTAVGSGQSVSGIVDTNTVWSRSGNPWQVTGDIVVTAGASLYILPGTIVEFQGNYKIRVEGLLQINGAADNRVVLRSADGTQWKGVEWIAGAAGALFNEDDVYQSGSALRNVDIQGAGANTFTWLRTELNIGLFLENVTLGDCGSPCLAADDLGETARIAIEGGNWTNGIITLNRGGFDLKNTRFDTVTLSQTDGMLEGNMSGNTLADSVIGFSYAMSMAGNIMSGGSLSYSRSDVTDGIVDSSGDSFTNTTVTMDEIHLRNGGFSGGSLSMGYLSNLDTFTLSATPLSALSGSREIMLKNGTITDSPVSFESGLVRDCTFTGTSPLSFTKNGGAKGNNMNGNAIDIAGYGAVEENTLEGASITLGFGDVINNSVDSGSIQITGTEKTKITGNTVSGASAEGIRVNSTQIVLVGNQVTNSDVGLLITNSDVVDFKAYDNTFTHNRVGIQWQSGCTADCELSAIRFALNDNTERAFEGNNAAGGLVNLFLTDSWWGSADPTTIKTMVFDRFHGDSDASNTVGLFFTPWISGPLETADHDGDGLVDILDGDDDDDGVCDAQEAGNSRLDLNPPAFFSPVNDSDTPAVAPDCDGDTIADADDPDDDNDGLLDAFETADLGTNPFSADTDGDGIDDKVEYDKSSDPLDNLTYPVPRLVPDTGQTKCYNGLGEEISPCPAPGELLAQDGSYTINPPDYTVNGADDTVIDNITGLIWQRQGDETQPSKLEASIHCDNLSLAGHSDWRLPDVWELASILDYGNHHPVIDSDVFPLSDYLSSLNFWSSTDGTRGGWKVGFGNGAVSDNVDDTEYVRCVRGGW